MRFYLFGSDPVGDRTPVLAADGRDPGDRPASRCASGRSGRDTPSIILLGTLGSSVPIETVIAPVAATSTTFAPPLVVFVVAFCLFCLLVALAIASAKRDVSIDFTVLEIRK